MLTESVNRSLDAIWMATRKKKLVWGCCTGIDREKPKLVAGIEVLTEVPKLAHASMMVLAVLNLHKRLLIGIQLWNTLKEREARIITSESFSAAKLRAN